MVQRDPKMESRGLQAGTKYTFAATRVGDEPSGVKVCPRCGETLFADMDVCYGCLYDFSRDQVAGQRDVVREKPKGITTQPIVIPGGADPLASIELDEIDDDPEPVAEPRHSRREVASADDTLNLALVAATSAVDERPEEPKRSTAPCIIVDSGDVRICMAVPPQGLAVGRGESNDIVLRSRSVSRSHLRIVPLGSRILVEDCGATNPAMLGDQPLEGSALLQVGDSVSICGTILEVAADSAFLSA